MVKKITTNQFIEKAIEIHKDRYDYSSTNYTNTRTKIDILCKVHGVFIQTPHGHLSGQGCPKCNAGGRLTTDEFIQRSTTIHGKKYKYSKSIYKHSCSKLKIDCVIHGEFQQRPDSHLRGRGCPKCGTENQTHTAEVFNNKATLVHNDLYDYGLVEYINAHTKVRIICKVHGVFEQTPSNHLKGHQCPCCSRQGLTRGEAAIKSCLEKLNISFIYQYRFPDLRIKFPLVFDFYLPKHNTLIEFDGPQHFKNLPEYFHNDNSFDYQKLRDKMKNDYAQGKNIKLLRIPYWEGANISSIIASAI